MILTNIQMSLLDDVKNGVTETVNFIGELTEYHGEPVTTEYILTVNIARSLLTRSYPLVGIEYLINQIKGHILVTDGSKLYKLGNQRFDVVVMDQIAPIFIVELKIKVKSISKLKSDIDKIMNYLEYLKPNYASSALGMCVFQTEVHALHSQAKPQTIKRIHKIEAKIKGEIETFALSNPSFEFDLIPFQGPLERIYDDEITQDVDGTPMLGKKGYAARYHAVLIRRRPPAPQPNPDNWLSEILENAESDSQTRF